METHEGNKLIAHYMGFYEEKTGEGNMICLPSGFAVNTYPNYKQWYELMPVIEKIMKQKFEDGETYYLRTFGMIDESGNYMVRFNRHRVHSATTLIECAGL